MSGDLIGHTTLRLYKPKCDLDEAWEQENLDSAVSRAINLLHKTTVRPRSEVIEGKKHNAVANLPASSAGRTLLFLTPLFLCLLPQNHRKRK